MTFRTLLSKLLNSAVLLDDNILVRLVERDKQGSVIKAKTVPISYINATGNICIEFEDINKVKWEK